MYLVAKRLRLSSIFRPVVNKTWFCYIWLQLWWHKCSSTNPNHLYARIYEIKQKLTSKWSHKSTKYSYQIVYFVDLYFFTKPFSIIERRKIKETCNTCNCLKKGLVLLLTINIWHTFYEKNCETSEKEYISLTVTVLQKLIKKVKYLFESLISILYKLNMIFNYPRCKLIRSFSIWQ